MRASALVRRWFLTKYTSEHLWVRLDRKTGDGVFGLTEFGQSTLGDVIHANLPRSFSRFMKGDIVGIVESNKVVEEIKMPLSGTIVEVNELLVKVPEVINQSAESNGWIAKFKAAHQEEFDKLMEADEYIKLVREVKDAF